MGKSVSQLSGYTCDACIPAEYPLPPCKPGEWPEIRNENKLLTLNGCDVLCAWAILQTCAKCFNTQPARGFGI